MQCFYWMFIKVVESLGQNIFWIAFLVHKTWILVCERWRNPNIKNILELDCACCIDFQFSQMFDFDAHCTFTVHRFRFCYLISFCFCTAFLDVSSDHDIFHIFWQPILLPHHPLDIKTYYEFNAFNEYPRAIFWSTASLKIHQTHFGNDIIWACESPCISFKFHLFRLHCSFVPYSFSWFQL